MSISQEVQEKRYEEDAPGRNIVHEKGVNPATEREGCFIALSD